MLATFLSTVALFCSVVVMLFSVVSLFCARTELLLFLFAAKVVVTGCQQHSPFGPEASSLSLWGFETFGRDPKSDGANGRWLCSDDVSVVLPQHLVPLLKLWDNLTLFVALLNPSKVVVQTIKAFSFLITMALRIYFNYVRVPGPMGE